MPWRMPDEETRRRVNAAFGTDMYQRLSEVWDAAMQALPGPVPAYVKTEQTRRASPERLRGAEGPISSTSAHYLGLAYDMTWDQWSPDQRARLANELYRTKIRSRNGTYSIFVEALGGGAWKPGAELPPGHLHWGVYSNDLQRLGFTPYIKQIVGALRIAGQ